MIEDCPACGMNSGHDQGTTVFGPSFVDYQCANCRFKFSQPRRMTQQLTIDSSVSDDPYNADLISRWSRPHKFPRRGGRLITGVSYIGSKRRGRRWNSWDTWNRGRTVAALEDIKRTDIKTTKTTTAVVEETNLELE